MDRGSYSAASAGLHNFRKLEVVNNNLANVNTPGFKKQVLVGALQTFDDTLAKALAKGDPYAKGDHDQTPGVINLKTATDFTPGALKNTGNPLDVALRNANDFFVINTAQGQQYTRAGDFTLNSDGELVTQDGQTVLGDGGSINVTGGAVSITPNGSVFANGKLAGRLQVQHFDDTSGLERVGYTRFTLSQGAPGPRQVDAEVEPESLEMSNVTVINSMLDLITANRAFDLYSRSARTIDEINGMSINQLGKRR